jgi:hypothetical protein
VDVQVQDPWLGGVVQRVGAELGESEVVFGFGVEGGGLHQLARGYELV